MSIGFVTATMLNGCDGEGCFESTTVGVNVLFFDSASMSQVAISKLTVMAFDNDSVLINQQSNAKNIQLILRPDALYSTFILNYLDVDIQDTIYFKYTNHSTVISMECGCATFSKIDSVAFTKHLIKSLIVRKNEVNNANEENIRILY